MTTTTTTSEPPSIDEVQTIFDPATCRQRGFIKVATTSKRSAPGHHIYHELHGSTSPTSRKLLFIMGLNNSSFGWLNQVRHFAADPQTSGGGVEWSVLVLDNRGVGWSDVPSGLYKTSEMAQDIVEVLDHVGWTENRSIHVVGVSMGGMIAKMLALAIPERICTLLLTSTQCGDRFTLPTRTSINLFARLMTNTAGGPDEIVSLVVESLFPKPWLDEELADGSTRRPDVEKKFKERVQMTRLQTTKGKIGQMAAVLTHKVDAKQLARIAASIPHVGIIAGDQDGLIDYHRSLELHDLLPGSTLEVVKGGGHALPSQIVDRYNEWIETEIEEGLKASDKKSVEP